MWGPPGAKYQAFKEAPYKDDFDEWLARIVCFAFSLPPTAFVRQLNRATAQTAQEAAQDEGLAPLMGWVKRLADHVIQELMGQGDLEFAWADLRPADPAEQAKVLDTYVRNGIYAINEARDLLGLDPVPGGDAPMVYGSQGAVPLGSSNTGPQELHRRGSGGCTASHGCHRNTEHPDCGPLVRKYNPDVEDEPRVPAGSPDGGQWTTGDGSESTPTAVASDGSGGGLTSTAQTGVAHPAVTAAQLTIPMDLPIEIPFDIPGMPTEVTPIPFDLPGAERRPPPSLPTNPFPRDPACAEEWAHAYEYCERMGREGKFRPGYSGPGKDMKSCLLGQVSERCGGNAV